MIVAGAVLVRVSNFSAGSRPRARQLGGGARRRRRQRSVSWLAMAAAMARCWLVRGFSHRHAPLAALRDKRQCRWLSVAPVALEPLPLQQVDDDRCFQVTADFLPAGDQPAAIAQITKQLREGDTFSSLQGITGTGKTLVMAHVVANYGRPTLVLCHNKTLAAQLTREFRSFFRHNVVELFVSYYNHYVPESYQEATGKYIAKKSSVNADIDILRHRATRALLTRRDVVIVASVSCIYGLGLPQEYLQASWECRVGQQSSIPDLLVRLDTMLYTQNDNDDKFERGQYQISSVGSHTTVTIWPIHEKYPTRIVLEARSGNDQQSYCVSQIGEGSNAGFTAVAGTRIFPAKHHVISAERREQACLDIEDELADRLRVFQAEQKMVEAQRLQQRVVTDVEMIRDVGFCSGGENYSRHFASRAAGAPPETLLDYFALHDDFLLMVDESHVTLPQINAMYAADQSRKHRLVKHGYRLPSALDNRPLTGQEFWQRVRQTVLVSATPSKLDLGLIQRPPVPMVIRPTFVCDPPVDVRPSHGQLENLLREVKDRVQKEERSLVMTLTKRDAEDLAAHFVEHHVNSTYIHSGLTTHERSDALRKLQNDSIDCLVGVNCLREGLDLPQVSLVAVLNADSQGFLRSETALLQMVGRAARHAHGRAIFYADRVTEAMGKCMDSTHKRREAQMAYNAENDLQVRSTKGSSTMSIFDLLKPEIDEERSLELVGDSASSPLAIPAATPAKKSERGEIETDHIPSSPGVYIWKDRSGYILYIGKAVNLRSRVRSYLSPRASHSSRIQSMIKKAEDVQFILTPSERDALSLESKLIKHHQPPFNVLLKDDQHYPYICASVGDDIPRFFIAPHRRADAPEGYRYFGPYTSFKEINSVLETIEEGFDLRSQAFLARHGNLSKEAYRETFNRALHEGFLDRASKDSLISQHRDQFEEAGKLFDSEYSHSRDVAIILPNGDNDAQALVHIVQLRQGMVHEQFSYKCEIKAGTDSEALSEMLQIVLEQQHYPSGGEASNQELGFFPSDILLSHPLSTASMRSLRKIVKQGREKFSGESSKINIRTTATRGPRKDPDKRAIELATLNALQVAVTEPNDVLRSFTDGSAANEIATMLSMETPPSRIECYDISHTQGDFAVGSRVVFVDGKPAPHLYRKFNVRDVGGDDYASLESVLARRFKRMTSRSDAAVAGDDAWGKPDLVVIDGGKGQLSAAIKGMGSAGVGYSGISPFSQDSDESLAVEGDNTIDLTGKHFSDSVMICALAKENELVYVPFSPGPVNSSPDSPGMLLLRSLRDESHRFALRNHRSRRSVLKPRPKIDLIELPLKNVEQVVA
jgi:excinuclease ABC subunit B